MMSFFLTGAILTSCKLVVTKREVGAKPAVGNNGEDRCSFGKEGDMTLGRLYKIVS